MLRPLIGRWRTVFVPVSLTISCAILLARPRTCVVFSALCVSVVVHRIAVSQDEGANPSYRTGHTVAVVGISIPVIVFVGSPTLMRIGIAGVAVVPLLAGAARVASREGVGWNDRSAGVITGRSAGKSSGVAKRGSWPIETRG